MLTWAFGNSGPSRIYGPAPWTAVNFTLDVADAHRVSTRGGIHRSLLVGWFDFDIMVLRNRLGVIWESPLKGSSFLVLEAV